jgi:hypothetical protein
MMDAESPATPQQVAEWMLEELKRQGYLDQDTAVDQIAKTFGKQFTYDNENGNLAIERNVLSTFRKLTKDFVVWDREDRSWRMRKASDKPGRQQD